MTAADVLQELGVEYVEHGDHKHSTSGWVQTDCPHCSPGSRKFRLGIPVNSRWTCNCWTCSTHKLPDTLALLSGRPLREIYALLGRIPATYAAAERPRGKLVIPKGVGPMQDCHRLYLKRRGIDPEMAEKLFGVQGIGFAAKLGWRLFLPVMLDGKPASWTTRSIRPVSDFKYVSAKPEEEAYPHKQLLYGEELVRGTVIVHEGPLDVLRTGPGSVATFGAVIGTAQVRRIAKYPTRVVCLDSDSAGRAAAEKLCAELSCFPGRTVRVELDAKDPGDASDREIKALRKMLK
jgi:hypothetical protein